MEIYDFQDCVANTMKKEFHVITLLTNDKILPFATFVKHENYNQGLWILACWSPKEEIAIKKHDEWVERLKAGVDFIIDMNSWKIYHREEQHVGKNR